MAGTGAQHPLETVANLTWPYLHPLERSSVNAFVGVYGGAAKKIQVALLATEGVGAPFVCEDGRTGTGRLRRQEIGRSDFTYSAPSSRARATTRRPTMP